MPVHHPNQNVEDGLEIVALRCKSSVCPVDAGEPEFSQWVLIANLIQVYRNNGVYWLGEAEVFHFEHQFCFPVLYCEGLWVQVVVNKP